jgi:hypothetical protein
MSDEARMKAAVELGREADRLAARQMQQEDSAYMRVLKERAEEGKRRPLTRPPGQRHKRARRVDDLLLEALKRSATC